MLGIFFEDKLNGIDCIQDVKDFVIQIVFT